MAKSLKKQITKLDKQIVNLNNQLSKLEKRKKKLKAKYYAGLHKNERYECYENAFSEIYNEILFNEDLDDCKKFQRMVETIDHLTMDLTEADVFYDDEDFPKDLQPKSTYKEN